MIHNKETICKAVSIDTDTDGSFLLFFHDSDGVEFCLRPKSQWMEMRFSVTREMAIAMSTAIFDVLNVRDDEIKDARPREIVSVQ